MKSTLQKKTEIVKEITNLFKTTNYTVIFEYQKLIVTEFTELRRMLAKKNVSVKVYKNNLVILAAKEVGFEKLNQFLTGPNAFAFGTGNDDMTAAKILAKFARTHTALKLKAGIYEGKILNTNDITKISLLPSKDELLAIFASNLLHPLRIFTIGIKEIAKIKLE